MKKTDIQFEAIVLALTKVFAHFDEAPSAKKFNPIHHFVAMFISTNDKIWDALGEELELLNTAGIKLFHHHNDPKGIYGFEIDNPQLLSIIRKHFTIE